MKSSIVLTKHHTYQYLDQCIEKLDLINQTYLIQFYYYGGNNN